MEEAEHIRPGKGHSFRYQHVLVVDTEDDGLEQLAVRHMGHSTAYGGGSPVAVAAVADGADDAVDAVDAGGAGGAVDVGVADSGAAGSVEVDGNSLEVADWYTHFGAGDAARTSYQTFEKSSYGTFRSHGDSVVVGTSWYRTSQVEGQHRKYRRRQPHAGRTTVVVMEHTLAGSRVAGSSGWTWCPVQMSPISV